MNVNIWPFIGALTVAVLVGVCAAQAESDEVYYHASYPAFASVEQLDSAADLVIEATILSSTIKELDTAIAPDEGASNDPAANPGGVQQDDPAPMVHTVHSVRIDRVIKGVAQQGATIEVKELGGTFNQTKYITPEGVLLQDEHSYVLFLETYDDAPASLLNPIQSVYEKKDNGLTSMPGNPLQASEVLDLA